MPHEKIKKAMGTEEDFPQDVVCTYMTRFADMLFEPKHIFSKNDWLATHREPEQRFHAYKNGFEKVKWLSKA